MQISQLIKTEDDFPLALNAIMEFQFYNVKKEVIEFLSITDFDYDDQKMISRIVSEWEQKEWRIINE